MENNTLTHHGILGMKWGVRRTEAQLARARGSTKGKKDDRKDPRKTAKKKPKAATVETSKKSVKEMSDDELAKAIRRSELEKRYADLNPQKVSAGKKFIDNAVVPAVTNAGRNLLQDFIVKKGKQYLGLDVSDKEEEYIKGLQKQVKKLNLEKQYNKLKSEQDEETTTSSEKKTENTKSSDSDSSSKSDEREKVYTGKVSGTGTSSNASKGRRWANDTVIDAEWRDVTPSEQRATNYAQVGERYVAGLLPEKTRR